MTWKCLQSRSVVEVFHAKILYSLAFIINTCFNFYKTKQWTIAQTVNKCVSALATMMYATIKFQAILHKILFIAGENVQAIVLTVCVGGDNVFYSWIYSLLGGVIVLLVSVVSIEIKKGALLSKNPAACNCWCRICRRKKTMFIFRVSRG